MRRSLGTIYAMLLIAAIAAAIPAAAQTGMLTGHVTDQQHAVIPGATVRLVREDGTKVQETTSDAQGAYSILHVLPGKYRVVAQAPGFAASQSAVLTVNEGKATAYDAVMEIAAENTQVEVNSGASQASIELDTASLSTNLSTQEIVNIGLNGRNFSQLIALAPGVSNQTGQDEAKVGVAGSAKFSVNGGRVEYNTFEVDGSDVLNTSINASRGQGEPLMVYPSIDAIQEMKVLTSNYSALYGKSASGSVIITTKSGGSKFHAVAYDFLRNELFNARNYFDQPIEKPNGTIEKRTPLYRRQDFGAATGGPIYLPHHYNQSKDKSFFFFSEEMRVEKTPVEFNQAVPTAAEREGDFSDVCPAFVPGASPYFNPSAYPDCPFDRLNNNSGAGYTPGRQVVVNNISKAILDTGIIPLPNATFGCNTTNATPLARCYNAAVSAPTYWREELFRIDHNVNANNQVALRFIHDSWNTTTLTPQWGIVQNSFPTVENKLDGPGLDVVASLTETLPHSVLNRLVVSYAVEHITLAPQPGPGLTSLEPPPELSAPCQQVTSGSASATECPIGYIFSPNSESKSKMPGFIFRGTNGAYGGHGFNADTGYAPWDQHNPTITLRDDVSKSLGRHLLQVGFEGSLIRLSELSAVSGANSGDTQGLLTFSNEQSLYTSGNVFADFLMGSGPNPGALDQATAIKSYTQDSGEARYHTRSQLAEFYVQDDFRLNKYLTINAGFRASVFGNWYNPENTSYNWRPGAYSASLGESIYIDPTYGYLARQTSSGTSAPGTPVTLPDRSGRYSLAGLDPVITNGLVRCGVNGVPNSCMSSHAFNPAPRVGFSLDPFGDGKTAIRGGYGLFWEHGTSNEANIGSLIGSAPTVLSETQTNIPAFAGGSVGAFNLIGYSCQDGLQQCGTLASSAGAVTFPLNVTSVPAKSVYSYAQQWSLSIQRELHKDWVAQVAYVGTRGTHLTAVQDLNQLSPLQNGLNPFGPGQPITSDVCNTGAAYNYFSVSGSNPVGQSGISNSPGIGPTSPGYVNMIVACTGNSGFVSKTNHALGISADTLRPYRGFSTIISVNNIASSSYHGLQATLRGVTGPVTLGASYTYSHTLDDSSDRADANFANSLDLKSNYSSSDFDQRHSLNVSYLYELPLVKMIERIGQVAGSIPESDSDAGANPPTSVPAAVRSVLDKWEISGITVFQTGIPFSVVNGGGANGTGEADNAGVGDGLGIGSYADVIGGAYGVKPVVSSTGSNIGPLLLNPAAFVAPRGLTFGNSGRNFLNNPSRVNFNLSLLKHFQGFKERVDFEFRAETFNTFNHTQFRIYDPSHAGNSGNNIINCYGDITTLYSAGASGCLTGNSFLHPVDAHDPRIIQFGLKGSF